ncbi:hypothetical protein [Sphingomonas sp.]|uniref:hypothetical protein n=1 Tax=Sphingomonas sp. TaxID=28214 RepID=UPI003B3A3E26
MSVLETPRILFRGNVAWDPIVTNNYQPLYDEGLAQTQILSTVQAFRQEAIGDVLAKINSPRGPSGNWNPHGTHRATFYDLDTPDPSCPNSLITASEVSGVDLGQGCMAEDPFVGASAQLNAMLVDLEPYGSQSSQLFFDTFSLGIEGGCRILARRQTRMIARYINFYRNPVFTTAGCASVIWQTSFRTSDLTIDAFDSPALAALQQALGEPGVIGLTMRFIAYRTVYYDTPELATDPSLYGVKAAELVAKLEAGGFQPNPARSKFVGVMGLWREGEPLNEPGDRSLVTCSFPAHPGLPTLGTAYARLGTDSIALDLSNSTPETGLDLTKQDWGSLALNYVDEAGEPQNLATIAYSQYDQSAYEEGSGILTIPLTAEQISAAANRDLMLVAQGNVMLQETALTPIPVAPNIYANQGDAVDVVFQIYDRGVPGGAGTAVAVYPLDFNGNIIGDPTELTADASGLVTLSFTAGQGEVIGYLPIIGSQPQPVTITPLVTPYCYVRSLPANSWMNTLEPSWNNVYNYVLANWNAMAPCMDNWLMLDDPKQVYAFGPMLKKLTDPANFENFRFMPVTRDMTVGERTLLYAFLNGPAPQSATHGLMGAVEGPAEAAPTGRPSAVQSIWTAAPE